MENLTVKASREIKFTVTSTFGFEILNLNSSNATLLWIFHAQEMLGLYSTLKVLKIPFQYESPFLTKVNNKDFFVTLTKKYNACCQK